ncbi:MBL fold metallo-hydrolase [Acidiphilium multivorum]|jgi:glyoxylase-like metal-dependent hydrolase (beta-lactamase superfamily II)|uniref:MBL fold metallo-hydrolase n=1 Tax=Acidiphilium multivorum TaxID=62140 RepID=UPI0039C94324
MILRQFLHSDPVAVSYLVGCGGHATGAVVDPLYPIEPYLEAAASLAVPLRFVIDTHLHADHRSAGRALAEAAGADYVLHESAATGFAFHGVADGDRLSLGNVVLDVLHAPGHTPEHLCLLVTDHTRAEEPWFVLTGHTLMVGDVGRTELASDAATGARDLFHSLARLKSLPDYLEVLPGAFAGSVCGRGLSGKPSSTIGFERRHNTAFAMATKADFVTFMMGDIPPPPENAAANRAFNAGLAAKAAE